MPSSKDERDRILSLVENGQVSASEAAQLLDTLDMEPQQQPERRRDRIVRVRTTNLKTTARKMHFTAAIPLPLLKSSVRLGAYLFPQLSDRALADLLRSIESGSTGRLLDLQDMELGERLEIFVE